MYIFTDVCMKGENDKGIEIRNEIDVPYIFMCSLFDSSPKLIPTVALKDLTCQFG